MEEEKLFWQAADQGIHPGPSVLTFAFRKNYTAVVIVQDVLVSEAVLTEDFRCALESCKGACCWEGDYGAPLAPGEAETLATIFEQIRPFLRKEGIAAIEEQGLSVYYQGLEGFGTPLLSDGACAFLTFENNGVAKCGIEKAWEAGLTGFQKPISCHLYPIRVAKNEELDFEALNYDEWDICAAACSAGKKDKIRVFEFAKTAIIRKYGEEFYEEMAAAAEYLETR